MIIIGCSEGKDVGKRVAKRLKKPYSELIADHFPDKESHIRFKVNLKGKKVVLVQSFYGGNEQIMEALFAAYTAKDLGAKKVILVAPYLAYMRQDKRFHSGECVSSHVVAKLFKIFDGIISIDPHLHRIKKLSDLFKKMKAKSITANPLMGDYIKKNFKNAVVVGPDEESYQWAKSVAKKAGTDVVVLKKKRYSSRNVKIKMNYDVEGKEVVIVDDIISTGHTIMEAAKEAKRLGAKNVHAVCVHGIFAENAYSKLKKLGVKKIVSTNTIPNKAAEIDVSGIIAESLN
ncbi:ribose-phosphate diphosphokinase [Candidatus Woesearchaeota archaeon]|nr:ribose-phosphate diphosphokinase [Candidatus Woesearchaeota archaeon]